MPYLPFGPHRMGVSAGGGLHWIGGRCGDLFGPRVIVSLDLGSDEFYELPQPEFGDRPFILTIGALGSGGLCVCAAYEDAERLDVWAMEEPGKKGKGRCWNRLYSIRDSAVGRRWALALGFWEGRMLFLLDRSGFAWYDPSKERVDVVEVDGPPEDVYFDAVYCLESLVKPFVWKVEGKKQAKQQNEKKTTWRKKEVFLMVTSATRFAKLSLSRDCCSRSNLFFLSMTPNLNPLSLSFKPSSFQRMLSRSFCQRQKKGRGNQKCIRLCMEKVNKVTAD
ncbi:unnamed protein product [Linum tenue]|uniref:F-box associated domain-containing protein n=1 Tax=Linum tenue TaxID=586396 RepID=A0AAV0MSQ3_9ROSI|nr:unnamed protein product [Linum tenue]